VNFQLTPPPHALIADVSMIYSLRSTTLIDLKSEFLGLENMLLVCDNQAISTKIIVREMLGKPEAFPM